MDKSIVKLCSLMGLIALLVGCNAGITDSKLIANAEYVPKGAGDVWIFDALVWQHVPAYPFFPAGKKCPPTVAEGGTVHFLWNEDYLFVMADMKDSDLVQESDKDNQHHYASGDVLEIFIRPAGQRCYWEIYATPNNRKTVFFYPSGGRQLPSCLLSNGMTDYQIKVELQGTLNNPADHDRGWRCIAAVPLKELRKQCPLDFNSLWLVQVARYNYSAYLEETEFSQIGITTSEYPNYHRFASYAKLHLDKKQ